MAQLCSEGNEVELLKPCDALATVRSRRAAGHRMPQFG